MLTGKAYDSVSFSRVEPRTPADLSTSFANMLSSSIMITSEPRAGSAHVCLRAALLMHFFSFCRSLYACPFPYLYLPVLPRLVGLWRHPLFPCALLFFKTRAMMRNPNKALLTLGPSSEILIVNEVACSLFACQVGSSLCSPISMHHMGSHTCHFTLLVYVCTHTCIY